MRRSSKASQLINQIGHDEAYRIRCMEYLNFVLDQIINSDNKFKVHTSHIEYLLRNNLNDITIQDIQKIKRMLEDGEKTKVQTQQTGEFINYSLLEKKKYYHDETYYSLEKYPETAIQYLTCGNQYSQNRSQQIKNQKKQERLEEYNYKMLQLMYKQPHQSHQPELQQLQQVNFQINQQQKQVQQPVKQIQQQNFEINNVIQEKKQDKILEEKKNNNELILEKQVKIDKIQDIQPKQNEVNQNKKQQEKLQQSQKKQGQISFVEIKKPKKEKKKRIKKIENTDKKQIADNNIIPSIFNQNIQQGQPKLPSIDQKEKPQKRKYIRKKPLQPRTKKDTQSQKSNSKYQKNQNDIGENGQKEIVEKLNEQSNKLQQQIIENFQSPNKLKKQKKIRKSRKKSQKQTPLKENDSEKKQKIIQIMLPYPNCQKQMLKLQKQMQFLNERYGLEQKNQKNIMQLKQVQEALNRQCENQQQIIPQQKKLTIVKKILQNRKQNKKSSSQSYKPSVHDENSLSQSIEKQINFDNNNASEQINKKKEKQKKKSYKSKQSKVSKEGDKKEGFQQKQKKKRLTSQQKERLKQQKQKIKQLRKKQKQEKKNLKEKQKIQKLAKKSSKVSKSQSKQKKKKQGSNVNLNQVSSYALVATAQDKCINESKKKEESQNFSSHEISSHALIASAQNKKQDKKAKKIQIVQISPTNQQKNIKVASKMQNLSKSESNKEKIFHGEKVKQENLASISKENTKEDISISKSFAIFDQKKQAVQNKLVKEIKQNKSFNHSQASELSYEELDFVKIITKNEISNDINGHKILESSFQNKQKLSQNKLKRPNSNKNQEDSQQRNMNVLQNQKQIFQPSIKKKIKKTRQWLKEQKSSQKVKQKEFIKQKIQEKQNPKVQVFSIIDAPSTLQKNQQKQSLLAKEDSLLSPQNNQ